MIVKHVQHKVIIRDFFLLKGTCKSRTLTFQKNSCHLLHWKSFRSDEKCSLFHLKSSLRSQDIYVVMNFWSYRKNCLIRKIRLTSKFMTSQVGLQTFAIHILPNISHSKGNQTMKFGQLIEHNKRNIFPQKLCGKWGRETSPKPLFIFLKSFIWGDSKWSAA